MYISSVIFYILGISLATFLVWKYAKEEFGMKSYWKLLAAFLLLICLISIYSVIHVYLNTQSSHL
jgi:uncharacterized membrane protein (DUF373 family)